MDPRWQHPFTCIVAGPTGCGKTTFVARLLVVSMRRIRDPKSVRLKDRDYDVTPNIIAHMYPQIRNGSVKECEVEMVGEECEVYCEDGRRRVLVLTGHAGRVAPISPMLKRRISCGLEILN